MNIICKECGKEFDFSSKESVDAISEDELNKFAEAHTTFKNWDDMLISAMEEYSAKVAAEDEKKNKSESE